MVYSGPIYHVHFAWQVWHGQYSPGFKVNKLKSFSRGKIDQNHVDKRILGGKGLQYEDSRSITFVLPVYAKAQQAPWKDQGQKQAVALQSSLLAPREPLQMLSKEQETATDPKEAEINCNTLHQKLDSGINRHQRLFFQYISLLTFLDSTHSSIQDEILKIPGTTQLHFQKDEAFRP